MEEKGCVVCGGGMRWETREEVLSYQGRTKTIQSEGYWCQECGEGLLTGKALLESERAFMELKAEVDGVLGPTEVARIRTRLGLSQRQAGELLGGGPRAFQKYESGKQAPSVPMSHLLRLLENSPSRLEEIRSRAPNTASADPVGAERG